MNETETRPSQNYIDNTRAQTLLEKWSPVLDYTSDKVSSIDNAHTRLNTAILLENEEEWCIKEANVSGGASGSFGTPSPAAGQGAGTYNDGDTYAASDARLPKILIPMIRRTFPELITNEIVGVQPMSGPVGLAFALRYRYEADSLGTGVDGKDFTPNGNRPGNVGGEIDPSLHSDDQEVGYNYLDTRFTGASSAALSGAPGVFDMVGTDTGVARLLEEFELTGDIPQMVVSFEKTSAFLSCVFFTCC